MRAFIDSVITIALGVLVVITVLVLISVITGCSMLPTPVPSSHSGSSAGTATQAAANHVGFILPLAILSVALGVAAIYAGLVKIGLSAAIGGLVSLVMTLMTIRFAGWMASLGALMALATVFVVLASRYKGAQTALSEVVQGVEAVKDKIVTGGSMAKEEINKVLADSQSPKTQEAVQAAKSQVTP